MYSICTVDTVTKSCWFSLFPFSKVGTCCISRPPDLRTKIWGQILGLYTGIYGYNSYCSSVGYLNCNSTIGFCSIKSIELASSFGLIYTQLVKAFLHCKHYFYVTIFIFTAAVICWCGWEKNGQFLCDKINTSHQPIDFIGCLILSTSHQVVDFFLVKGCLISTTSHQEVDFFNFVSLNNLFNLKHFLPTDEKRKDKKKKKVIIFKSKLEYCKRCEICLVDIIFKRKGILPGGKQN